MQWISETADDGIDGALRYPIFQSEGGDCIGDLLAVSNHPVEVREKVEIVDVIESSSGIAKAAKEFTVKI